MGYEALRANLGVNREALYRSLSRDGNPELATVMAVVRSLNLNLAAHPLAAG